MALLEDIGRAPQVGELTRSLEQRSRDITAQARQERVDTSAIELNTLEANKRRNELQEQQRVQEVRGRSLDITTHPMYQGLDPESQKSALDYMSSGGYTDKAGVGTIGSIQTGMQTLESSKDAFTTFTSVVIKGKRAAFDAAQKEVNEYTESGKSLDDKSGQMLQQKLSNARNAYNASLDSTGKHRQKLEQIEATGRVAAEVAADKLKTGTVKEKQKVEYLISLGIPQDRAVDMVFERKRKSPRDTAQEVYIATINTGESEEVARDNAKSSFEYFTALGKEEKPEKSKTGDIELDALMKELTEALK